MTTGADLAVRLEQHRLYLASINMPQRQGEMISGEGFDFRGLPLTGACLADAVVPSSDFSGSDMAGADLFRGNFASCCFIGTNLSRSNLNKSTLAYADLTRAILRGAGMRRADLDNAVLRQAVLDGADLYLTLMLDTDLRHASLRNCNLAAITFQRVRVAGADMRGAVGFEAGRKHEIDVGEGEVPQVLAGDAASAWLLDRMQ